MKKKALIVVNLAGFLHFLWNDISTLQEMGYEVSVAMNENSAAGPNLIEIPKLEEMGIAHYQVNFDTKSPISRQNVQAYKQLLVFVTDKTEWHPDSFFILYIHVASCMNPNTMLQKFNIPHYH